MPGYANNAMFKYTDPVLWFCYYNLTLEKVHPVHIAAIINFQIWIIQFFVTYLCAWIIITRRCPWLSTQTCADKKDWFMLFIRKFRKKDIHKENFEEK